MTSFDIIEVEPGIWTLQEDGKNVFLGDCQKFDISKKERRELLLFLRKAVDFFEKGLVDVLIERGNLKRLSRQPKAMEENLWEVRRDGDGARILFIQVSPGAVVVAAVHKNRGSLSQAVHRGVNRWRSFLKTRSASVFRIF